MNNEQIYSFLHDDLSILIDILLGKVCEEYWMQKIINLGYFILQTNHMKYCIECNCLKVLSSDDNNRFFECLEYVLHKVFIYSEFLKEGSANKGLIDFQYLLKKREIDIYYIDKSWLTQIY